MLKENGLKMTVNMILPSSEISPTIPQSKNLAIREYYTLITVEKISSVAGKMDTNIGIKAVHTASETLGIML
jgi:hypothetical protein